MTISAFSFPNKSFTGWGAKNKLVEVVDFYKAENILCITDNVLVELGIVERALQEVQEGRRHIAFYADFEMEPSLNCAQKLVDYMKEYNFDLVLGIGGGSTLDLAKLAAVLAVHEGDVKDYLNLTGSKKIKKRGLPTVLMPTTAGTGSEVTDISVLSLSSTKDVITHEYLLADVAIVDPALTVSVPPRVTAATGVDALTHAIEAYVSVQANDLTDALALRAVELITASLEQAFINGKDREARTKMSMGSFLAGISFFHAGVAGVHALAYPLGGQFHIAHGEANAVLLPYVMNYIRPNCTERLADLYAIWTKNYSLGDEEAAEKFIEHLVALVEAVKIPKNLQQLQIDKEALPKLTADAIKQTRLLARSPRKLDKKAIYHIYERAYFGTV